MKKRGFKGRSKRRTHRKGGPYGKQVSFYKSKRYAMYRSPRLIMPQEYVTTLRYGVQSNNANVGSFAYTVLDLRSDAFDLNPALASTAMAGFTELAAIYQTYRCLRMGYKVTYVNNEAFPVTVTALMGPVRVIGGTTLQAISAIGNPLAKVLTLSAKGGMDKSTIKANHSIVSVSGTRNSLFADDWEGNTTPSLGVSTLGRVVWLNATVESESAGTAAGVFHSAVISLTLQFASPRPLFG